MEKIITSKGIFDINIPKNAKTNSSGEHYIVCPICSSSRKPEHKAEAKLGINMHKIPHPWRCNHCGEGGYIIDQQYMDNAKIKPILENKKYLPISDPLVVWFWEKRAISKKTLEELDISSSQEQIRQLKHIPGEEDQYNKMVSRRCINFKYKKDGILINIKYRDKNKNFKMIQGASKIFYNIDSLKGKKEGIIVEGEMDVCAYHECELTAVVSVPNGVPLSPAELDEFNKTGSFRTNLEMEYLDNCIEDFSKLETIYLATDDDPPGIKLREELARRLGKARCRIVKFSDYKKPDGTPCKDANDVLIHHGKDVLRNTLSYAKPYPLEGVTTAMKYWDKLESIFDNGRQKGFSTGYKSLDPHFTWMPGWMVLVNGYPGEGKTSAMLNLIMITTVLYGWKWGIYSPENYPPENVIDTMVEIIVGDTSDISFGDRMSKQRYFDAIKNHIEKHIHIVDNENGYTPEELRKVKKALVKQYGINGFFTDPWKNLYHDMGNMSIDMYLQRELSAEVRLSVKNELINVISHHPPTPPRDKEKNYPAPSYFELTGGQIWAASAYAMVCIHKHDRSAWTNTMTEFHVQKIKEHKLAGIPTDRNNPVLIKYDRRSGRFLEREDVSNIDSPYTVFPFKEYSSVKSLVFDGF